MIENIRKMWKIPELRRKIIYTFLMLVLFRLISMIPAPGVNYAALKEAMLNGGTINGNLPLMDLVKWRWVLHPTSTPALLCSC